MEDGIAEGLQNWFKILNHLYVDLIEPRKKNDAKVSMTEEEFAQAESALQEQRLNTIYTVSFYIDSFFSVASAIIELQKFTRYLRVRTSISFWMNQNRFFSPPESAGICETTIEGICAISLWSVSDDRTRDPMSLIRTMDHLTKASKGQGGWLRSGTGLSRSSLSNMLVCFRPRAFSNRLIRHYPMIIRARSMLWWDSYLRFVTIKPTQLSSL